MGAIEICLILTAAVLGFVFGHENGRRNAMEEMVTLQEYEQSKKLWEESMKNLSGRYYHENDGSDEEEDSDDN